MPAVKDSRREQVRQATKVLQALLRTPKSRAGLIAATTKAKITRNFVYGWLTEQVRTGLVVQLKSTNPPMFQRAEFVAQELPAAGSFPSWLEPRALPMVGAAPRVYISGQLASNLEERKSA